jgi:hypothetical protein
VGLLEFLASQAQSRFIAFVDSRKQVELISSILNRLLKETQEDAAGEEGRQGPGRARGGRAKKAAARDEPVIEEPMMNVKREEVLSEPNVAPLPRGLDDQEAPDPGGLAAGH